MASINKINELLDFRGKNVDPPSGDGATKAPWTWRKAFSAARELIATKKLSDRFAAMLPMIFKARKARKAMIEQPRREGHAL